MHIPMHDLWCHMEHPSQHTPKSDQLTGLSQKAHGKCSLGLGLVPGPGFSSTSPAIKNNKSRINRLGLVDPDSGACLKR